MADERYPLALPPGSILAGQYIIEQVLGQGGFGITYKALDHKRGRKVAIKEYFPDSMATRTKTQVTAFAGERAENFTYGKTCFLQEAETLAQFIGNESIVRVYSYFEENQTAYFVMEYVEGISFEEYIREHGGKVSYEEAERILLPVIDALAAVHSRGIIHRDVTPDNICITKYGKVKLLDFGAARYSLGDKSRSLDVVLKHGFAPKEQYTRRGKQGPFTDVYTLGASFYFAITGRRPPDSIDRLEEDELIPPGNLGVSIPPVKEEAILKAMSVQPSERFQSMEEFSQALFRSASHPISQEEKQIALAGRMEQQIPPKPEIVSPKQKRFNNKFLWAGAGSAAAIVVIAVAVIAYFNSNLYYQRQRKLEMIDNEDQIQTANLAHEDRDDGDGTTIRGNTWDNLSRGGFMAGDGIGVALTDMENLYFFDYENLQLLDTGDYIYCISMIGDKIYYTKDGKAYCVNKDGSNKEKIPQLADYEAYILYVSDKYYYIGEGEHGEIKCISRSDGKLLGSIEYDECNVTLLNGYFYYADRHDGQQEIYRIPADNFEMTPELVYCTEEYQLYGVFVSEGDYVYEVGEDTNGCIAYVQYNTKTNQGMVYELKDWSPRGLVDVRAADQYIYLMYENENGTVISRFKAEENTKNPAVETVCEFSHEWSFPELSLSLVGGTIVTFAYNEEGYALAMANMEGDDEPLILDKQFFDLAEESE